MNRALDARQSLAHVVSTSWIKYHPAINTKKHSLYSCYHKTIRDTRGTVTVRLTITRPSGLKIKKIQ